jgi:hypothetical protein
MIKQLFRNRADIISSLLRVELITWILLKISYSILLVLQIGVVGGFLLVKSKSTRIQPIVLVFCFIFLIASGITSLYYGTDLRILFAPLFFIASLLLVDLANVENFRNLTQIASVLLMVFIVTSVLSVIYMFLGGSPILNFVNPDGRESAFFLFSLSNTPEIVWKNTGVIRPSSIYDEPGALSFVICFVAAMRHILSLNRRTTWIILLGGLVTFSLAHIIYMLVHLVSEEGGVKKIKYIVLVGAVVGAAIALNTDSKIVKILFLSRFEVTKDGNFEGDNRSKQLKVTAEMLDTESFFWGLDGDCILDSVGCKDRYPGIGAENPVAPLVYKGIFVSLAYYLILLIMLVLCFKNSKYWVFFGLVLLLFQRPYTMNMGYSLMALIPVFTIWKAGFRFPESSATGVFGEISKV